MNEVFSLHYELGLIQLFEEITIFARKHNLFEDKKLRRPNNDVI